MTIPEKAVYYHSKGFNCAQAVYASCAELADIDEETALSVAGGFGGGVRCGEICGAASGAVMALGTAFRYCDSDDADAKNKIAKLTKKFIAEFKGRFGCVRCFDLKGNSYPCDDLIYAAAEIAEKLLITEKENI